LGGTKIHALFHTQEQILWHGIPDVTDTMTMERAHCADAVELYALSSKQNSTQIIEITTMLLEKRYNALLSRRINNQDVEDSQSSVKLSNYLNYTIEKRKSRLVENDPDATNFERVNNLGKVKLVYNNTQWELKNVNDKLPLHNFVSLSDLTVMLQAYAMEEFDEANVLAQQAILELIQNPNSTKFSIQLEFGIKIIPSINSGMELTIIYATNNFVKERANDVRKNKIIKRHDSVEVGDSDYQQVLGILSVIQLSNTEETSIGTLIIGASYEVTIKNKFSKLMPYTELKYKFKENNRSLDISIFELDYVNRPLRVIPQRQYWTVPNTITYSNIKNFRMW